MPLPSRLLQQFWTAAAGSSSELQQGGVLSYIVTRCIPVQQQQCSAGRLHLSPSGDGAHHSSRRQQSSFLGLSKQEQELLRSASAQSSSSHAADSSLPGSSSTSSTSSSRRISSSPSPSSSSSSSGPSNSQTISASCDVPRDHVLHELYHARQQTIETSGSNTALYKLPSRISAGSVSAEEFARSCSAEDHVLSRFYEEGVHGGLGRRFRRKVPLFQVIEFYANGTAIEEYKPRTPQQLGLHPRDVVLFAPLSRLAAPQRATIVVHEEKVLVKTEIVKAIITPDKAVLIKGRRTADTQKLTQNILAANDQRLMAIALTRQQQAAARAAASQIGTAQGCSRAASAAQLLKAAELYNGNVSAWEHLAEDDDRAAWGAGPAADSSSGGGGSGSSSLESGFYGDGAAAAAPVRRSKRRKAGLRHGSRTELQDVPFGMLVLEVLLDATTEYFYTKVQHLNWMLESVAADIRQPNHSDTDSQAAVDKAHQLLPIQKFLTALKNDVKETADAIKAALDDHDTLHELCETWAALEQARWTAAELARRRARLALDYPGDAAGGEEDGLLPGEQAVSMIYGATTNKPGYKVTSPDVQRRMMVEMLESYDREIQSLEGSINEAEEDLDNTRALWHMQMDSRRNHIIMVNLWLSMLNISVMATTVLPAFFGMNLASGLAGDDPRFFLLVCGGSLALSALAYPASRSWYNRNWRRINQNELFEQKLLRTILVQHIEDIDAIIRLVRHIRYKWIDRHAFRQLMMATLGSRVISPAHIDFLWQAYDSDRDDFVAECEKIRPLNTYHSGSGDLHLQQEPNAAAGGAAPPSVGSSSSSELVSPVDAVGSSPLSSAGYQQYLQQQQQLLMPPHQQQQQQQQELPLDSWAGLMPQSTLDNLEEAMRRSSSSSSSSSGGSSGSSGGSRRPRSQGNWDEDWEGPSISDDEPPGRSRLMGRLAGWLKKREQKKERKLRQHMREEEQLQVERELLHQADLREQQRKQREEQQHRDSERR